MTETEKKLVDAERAVDEAKQAVQDIRKAIESEAAEARPQWKVGDCFRYFPTCGPMCRMIVDGKGGYLTIGPRGEYGMPRNESIDELISNYDEHIERITFKEWAESR